MFRESVDLNARSSRGFPRGVLCDDGSHRLANERAICLGTLPRTRSGHVKIIEITGVVCMYLLYTVFIHILYIFPRKQSFVSRE